MVYLCVINAINDISEMSELHVSGLSGLEEAYFSLAWPACFSLWRSPRCRLLPLLPLPPAAAARGLPRSRQRNATGSCHVTRLPPAMCCGAALPPAAAQLRPIGPLAH